MSTCRLAIGPQPTASRRAYEARLIEMPLLGKATDEANVHIIIEPQYLYRVFYSLNNEDVVVIGILHGRQR